MRLHNLKPAAGSSKRRKVVGRGSGSGHGKTSTRGHKGQGARSGGMNHGKGFEGGQTPMHRRLPKRGFVNIYRDEYRVVNLLRLERMEGVTEFTPEIFIQKRIAGKKDKVKILGSGEITRNITVSAHAFSKTAKRKIEAAGGKIVEI
ncbi:MAG: 50S ribosomal protein L15 [bacterium]|nr:MAG: 50S ribosomal protein L15 [bacterium]